MKNLFVFLSLFVLSIFLFGCIQESQPELQAGEEVVYSDSVVDQTAPVQNSLNAIASVPEKFCTYIPPSEIRELCPQSDDDFQDVQLRQGNECVYGQGLFQIRFSHFLFPNFEPKLKTKQHSSFLKEKKIGGYDVYFFKDLPLMGLDSANLYSDDYHFIDFLGEATCNFDEIITRFVQRATG